MAVRAAEPAVSNTRRTRRQLSNVQVFERVERFMRTGDRRHLPPALRAEADAIAATLVATAVAHGGVMPPWPRSAVGPDPGPDAPIGDVVRALAGNAKADALSGFEARS